MVKTQPSPRPSGRLSESENPLTRLDCQYTSCYCEENVYLLAERLQRQLLPSDGQLFVVFMSNCQQKVRALCHWRCLFYFSISGTCYLYLWELARRGFKCVNGLPSSWSYGARRLEPERMDMLSGIIMSYWFKRGLEAYVSAPKTSCAT
jgi:hypothetical protein